MIHAQPHLNGWNLCSCIMMYSEWTTEQWNNQYYPYPHLQFQCMQRSSDGITKILPICILVNIYNIFGLLIEMHMQISPMNKQCYNTECSLPPPHLWNCLHNQVHHLMIPLPLKQNQKGLICMDTSFCSKQEIHNRASKCMHGNH